MTCTPFTRAARLAAALVVAGVATLGPPASGAAAPDAADDLKFLPADSNVLFVIRMDQLLASDGFQKYRKQVDALDELFGKEFEGTFGVASGNVERMLMGVNVDANQWLNVIRLKQPVRAMTIAEAAKREVTDGKTFEKIAVPYVTTKVGEFTVYKTAKFLDDGFCLVDPKTLLFGKYESVKAALERNKKSEFGAGMQAALKEMDPTAPVNLAVDLKALLAAEKPPMVPGVDFNKVADNVSGAALAIKVGKDVDLRGVAVCKDARGAQEVKKQADALLMFITDALKKAPKPPPKEILELPGKVRTATQGNLAVATLSVPSDQAVMFLKLLVSGPGAPPPPKPEKP